MTQPPYGTPPPQPGQPAMGGSFYIAYAGQEQGPVDFNAMAQMAVAGQLKGDAQVRQAEGGQWFPAKQIPGLFSDKEWLTTVLLSWFLGSFGVDRFYLGQTGLGIGKLCLSIFTCFTLGWIWALIDAILITMRKVTDAEGRPLA